MTFLLNCMKLRENHGCRSVVPSIGLVLNNSYEITEFHLAADGGDEDDGEEFDEDERAPGAYPRSAATSAPDASAPSVLCASSSSGIAGISALDDATKPGHASVTHWPKAPMIDVPKEAKIHQGTLLLLLSLLLFPGSRCGLIEYILSQFCLNSLHFCVLRPSKY